MSLHRDSVYLRHMLEYAEEVLGIAKERTRESLESDSLARHALLHLFCVLGEAANRVSPEGQAGYSGVPWKHIIGMRNRLIHGYDIVDLDIVWETAVVDLPVLVSALKDALLPEE